MSPYSYTLTGHQLFLNITFIFKYMVRGHILSPPMAEGLGSRASKSLGIP